MYMYLYMYLILPIIVGVHMNTERVRGAESACDAGVSPRAASDQRPRAMPEPDPPPSGFEATLLEVYRQQRQALECPSPSYSMLYMTYTLHIHYIS